MLTLQELKQVVSNREERRKVPSAKYLRENEVAVAKQRLMDCAEIIAYQTGYVLYCVGDYATVFPLLYPFLSLRSGTKRYENVSLSSFFLYNSSCRELGILQITER